MAKSKGDMKGILPSSIRVPADKKQDIEDYCWLNHTTFNALMLTLIDEFLKSNPLTPSQKKFIEQHRKKD